MRFALIAAAVLPLLDTSHQDAFDVEFQRLAKGREYRVARTGSFSYEFAGIDGSLFQTFIEVPASYDPARRWPVRVQLHGGVSRPLEPGRPRVYAFSASTPEIAVYPKGWHDAKWWQASQVDNIGKVLARLKREYNVDESRVYVTGFSDGATGAYFLGMRSPTLFAAIMPLHGSLAVLANPASGADAQMFLGNLVNRPIFATNGGRDRLYPAATMVPVIESIRRAGAEVEYLALPLAGHDRSWWPAERERFEKLVAAHPRRAHRDRLSWETERTDRYNRVDWLIINDLGATPSDRPLPDTNAGFFPRPRRSGRVDVVRTGNTFDAQTRGVRKFTLLLSPDVVDFSLPVKVVVNGRTAIERLLTRDRSTLLEWADRDNDRTVLYAAELMVEVK